MDISEKEDKVGHAQENKLHVLFGFDNEKYQSAIVKKLEKHGYTVKTTVKYSKAGIQQYLQENEVDAAVLTESIRKGIFTEWQLAELNDTKDINIIVLTSPSRKGTDFAKVLYSAGITSAIFADSFRPIEVAQLIMKKRTRQEARNYYGINKGLFEANTVTQAKVAEFIDYLRDPSSKESLEDKYTFFASKLTIEQNIDLLNKLPDNIIQAISQTDTFKDIEEYNRKNKQKGKDRKTMSAFLSREGKDNTRIADVRYGQKVLNDTIQKRDGSVKEDPVGDSDEMGKTALTPEEVMIYLKKNARVYVKNGYTAYAAGSKLMEDLNSLSNHHSFPRYDYTRSFLQAVFEEVKNDIEAGNEQLDSDRTQIYSATNNQDEFGDQDMFFDLPSDSGTIDSSVVDDKKEVSQSTRSTAGYDGRGAGSTTKINDLSKDETTEENRKGRKKQRGRHKNGERKEFPISTLILLIVIVTLHLFVFGTKIFNSISNSLPSKQNNTVNTTELSAEEQSNRIVTGISAEISTNKKVGDYLTRDEIIVRNTYADETVGDILDDWYCSALDRALVGGENLFLIEYGKFRYTLHVFVEEESTIHTEPTTSEPETEEVTTEVPVEQPDVSPEIIERIERIDGSVISGNDVENFVEEAEDCKLAIRVLTTSGRFVWLHYRVSETGLIKEEISAVEMIKSDSSYIVNAIRQEGNIVGILFAEQ